MKPLADLVPSRQSLSRLFLAVALVVFAAAASGCVYVPISGQGDFGVRQASLFGERRIGQEFYVGDRNLARVDVYLFPSKILRSAKNAKNRKLISRTLGGKSLFVKVFALPEKTKVAELKMPVSKIRDAKMYAFVFKPVANSKKKRFYVEVQAPEVTSDLSLAVKLTSLDHYKDGQAYINGEPQADADLGFQTYIDMSFRQLVNSIGARLAADPIFVLAWAALVLVVMVLTAMAWMPSFRGRMASKAKS